MRSLTVAMVRPSPTTLLRGDRSVALPGWIMAAKAGAGHRSMANGDYLSHEMRASTRYACECVPMRCIVRNGQMGKTQRIVKAAAIGRSLSRAGVSTNVAVATNSALPCMCQQPSYMTATEFRKHGKTAMCQLTRSDLSALESTA